MALIPDTTGLHRAKELFDAGRLQEAEDLAAKAVERDRKNAEALQILGMVALRRGRYDDASRWYERLVSMRRDRPILHCALAQARVGQGRFREAMARYEQAIKLDPNCLPAIAGKANVLELRGRHDRARTLLQPFIDRGDETGDMALTYATIELNHGDAERAVEIARRRADGDGVSDEVRRSLWFVIGQARHRLKQCDDAFAAYEQANALAGAEYDVQRRTSEIDRLIATFSADRMASLARVRDDLPGDEVPVFVVGMPRSGSTLVEQVLDAHPQAAGAGELDLMNALVRDLPETADSAQPYPECLDDLPPEQAVKLARRYLDGLRRFGRKAVRIVDKNLRNLEQLGLIALLFPKSRAIYCRRHPLDLCLSCWFQNLSPTQHPYAADLRHLGHLYVEYERLMAHWRETLELKILDIQYEEFVADQEGSTRRLLEFCDLPWDDRCLRFYESNRDVATLSYDQVRRPVYQSAVKRYERYEKHLGPLREALGDAV